MRQLLVGTETPNFDSYASKFGDCENDLAWNLNYADVKQVLGLLTVGGLWKRICAGGHPGRRERRW